MCTRTHTKQSFQLSPCNNQLYAAFMGFIEFCWITSFFRRPALQYILHVPVGISGIPVCCFRMITSHILPNLYTTHRMLKSVPNPQLYWQTYNTDYTLDPPLNKLFGLPAFSLLIPHLFFRNWWKPQSKAFLFTLGFLLQLLVAICLALVLVSS